MYSIVRNADSESLKQLFPLLEDPLSKRWLAHQLVELHNLPLEIENQCFYIVEQLAAGDSAEAFGESLWLKEWSNKLGRT